MRLTEEAVVAAIRYTETEKDTLERNYVHMRNTVMPLLAEWKDKNVEHFMEIMELFDSYVKVTASNMDNITEILKYLQQQIIWYNS